MAHRIGNNFIINSVLDTASLPKIAVRKDGSFGVCWYETNGVVANRARFKFRIFNNLGIPISNEIVVNDNVNIITPSSRNAIDTDSSGRFVATFHFNGDIFFQNIDKFGNKNGANVKINDDTGSYGQLNTDIVFRQDRSFIVCWQDARPPVPYPHADDIFMQMYDSSGTKIGNNSRVNDIIDLQDEEYEPSISSDTSGAFCIVFSRWNFIPNTTNAVIQYYDKNGNKIGNNINVIGNTDAFGKVISKRSNGDMIIGYIYDYGLIYRQFIQRRLASGVVLGNVFQVSNQATNLSNWFGDATLFNNKIISVISDERNGNSDIFCNIRSFTNPDSVTSVTAITAEIPSSYSLGQNYPNPFNPSTKIRFSVPQVRHLLGGSSPHVLGGDLVQLKVYDVMGREVQTMVNQSLKPGTYEVTFDGSAFTSGVYFYKLQCGDFVQTNRMVLIK
ncbi:MAG: T9SS type A sorting domain-containing protein [Ignavibacteriae bacterium]|nr:T9SS type A sorting domain-containing protein [Ignavibacteriota bacterium]